MKRLVFLVLACVSCMVGVGQNLTRIEYFIDTDPGYGSATNVPFTSAATVSDLTFAVPLTAVTDGFHTLNVRSRDANNKWSLVQSRPFYRFTPEPITAPALSRIEYYIDTDPGYGAGTNVTFTAGNVVTDLAFTVPLGSVTDGFHTLFIRTRDANNKWSLVQSRPFFKAAAPAALANINRIEYFIDTDPGYGAGTSVTFSAAPTVTDLVFNVDVSADSQGSHKLYVRSRDANNKWSLLQVRDFSVCNQPAPVASAASVVTTSGFNANWAAAVGATSYTLDVSTDNFATFVSGFNAKSVTATTQAVTGLTAGTSYSYRVSSVNATCTSVASPAISAITLFTTPSASAATAITPSGFTANWAAVTGAIGYQLDISADNFATFINGYNSKSVTSASEVVTGLTASTAYQYRVRATNGVGTSANSSALTATTTLAIAAPVAAAATQINSSGFTANWAAVTGATGYQLDISSDNFANYVTGYNSKAITGVTDTVTGLTASTAYKYRVRATNANGTSANSNSIDVTTAATKPSQTITFAALPAKTFGDAAFALAATASSQLAVSYASSNTAVATISGNTVTIVGAGTSTITASQAGNDAFAAATSVAQTLTVNKANQTITFAALPAKSVGSAAFALTATGGASGLPVTFVSSNTSVATVSGSTVTIIAAGTTNITASQAGNANYNAATDVVQVLTVTTKPSQTITFGTLPAKTFGDAVFTLSATSSSQLAVSYASSNTAVATISGNTVTIVGAGTSTITASQAGNDAFAAAANVTQLLTVNKASQTITFAALPARSVGSAAFALTATGGASGLPITFVSSNTAVATITGSTVTIVAAGTTNITASQAGNANYNAATDVVQALTVTAKQNQTITFAALADKTLGDAAFALTGTASSGLAVAYSTTSDKITINGSQVTLVKAGRASIVANQGGNDAFNAATAVTQSFCIKPAKPTVTLSNTNTETVTLTSNASAGNQWYLAGTAIAGATNATLAVTAPGVYKVQVKVDDCSSEFSADQTIIVTGDIKLDASSVSISPNPVNEVLQLNGIMGEIKSTHLFDMTGRASSPLTLEKKNDVYQASVEHLNQGVYVLRVVQENKVVQIKFIKK
jgi:hypothetical protein